MKILLILFTYISVSYTNSNYSNYIKIRDNCLYLTEPVQLNGNVQAIAFDKINTNKALKACEKSYKKNPNDAHTIFLLARAYTKDEQYQKGLKYSIIACDKGDIGGCTLLAGYYYKGFNIKIDKKKALLLYLSSCAKGDPVACTNLAQIKDKNNIFGSKIIQRKSSDLLLEACVLGNYPEACSIYANHINNNKVPYDQDRYEYTSYKACVQGIESSCLLLWNLYNEYKISNKKRKIMYAKELSCQNGNKKACSK